MSESHRQELLDRLRQGPVIIGDGAMGTQLYHRGAPLDAVFEYLNLLQPDRVSRVHADYAAAGAGLLGTTTAAGAPGRLLGTTVTGASSMAAAGGSSSSDEQPVSVTTASDRLATAARKGTRG